MPIAPRDSIVAIATAPGKGAVGIVRVSGTGVDEIVEGICGRKLRPREATYVSFYDGHGGSIDKGIALYFEGPHSYTGEDVLELQAHGGPVVLSLLLARCLSIGSSAGIRIARPGEFTERAFLNGKLDLAQAEAVADLIDAGTVEAARGAARSLAGEFSRKVGSLLDATVHLRMLVEATLDFPEEEIDFLNQANALGQLDKLQRAVSIATENATQGVLLREGMTVVIAGQPNSGKSSILNALSGAEIAIVTPVAGTTRDRIRQTIQIEGVPVHIVDTAGLRSSSDMVESIGIERAWEAIKDSDAVLFIHDLARACDAQYQDADAQIAKELSEKLDLRTQVIHVWNKVDIGTLAPPSTGIALSAMTGEGIQLLRLALLKAAGWQSPAGGAMIARERHLQALREVANHLRVAREHLESQKPHLEILAEELRVAQRHLSEITGAFTSDDLLGVIFSEFCIGK